LDEVATISKGEMVRAEGWDDGLVPSEGDWDFSTTDAMQNGAPFNGTAGGPMRFTPADHS
jgi:hypothetical protein